MIRSNSGPWILLAAVVGLAYLIARPHVGTVWYVTKDWVTTPPTGTLPPGLKPVTPPPGFVPDTPPPSPPPLRYIDKRDCFNAEMRYETATGTAGAYCASENALLWGW